MQTTWPLFQDQLVCIRALVNGRCYVFSTIIDLYNMHSWIICQSYQVLSHCHCLPLDFRFPILIKTTSVNSSEGILGKEVRSVSRLVRWLHISIIKYFLSVVILE